MSTEPRLQTSDLVLTSAQPLYGAAQEHTVRSFRPSAFTVNGFTDANLDQTAVGLWAIPEDGSLRNTPRQIKSVSGTTATLDAPWFATTGVTVVRAWQPGEVMVRVTTADVVSTFDVVSSPHAALAAEPDDFWKKYMLIGVTGANAGMAKEVTGFVSSSGTFTAAANFGTAIGDLFMLRMMVRPAGPVTAKVTMKTMERTITGTGSQGGDMPMILANEGSVSLEMEQRPIPTPGLAATQAVSPVELGSILRDFCNESRDTGGAITAIDANTITTSNGVFTKNGFALLPNGCAVHILAATGAAITKYAPGQAGNTANVPVGSTAVSSVHWERKQQAWLHRLWDLFMGGKHRMYLGGCMPTVNMKIDRENTVKFALAYTSSEPLEYDLDRWVSLGAAFPLNIPDVGVPFDGKGARCMIDGVAVTMVSMEANFGFAPEARPSLNGMMQNEGCIMKVKAPSGRFKIYADQNDKAGYKHTVDRALSGVPFQFLYQKGTAPGNTWCWASATACYTGGEFTYEGEQGMFDMPFTCVDPQVASDGGSTLLYPVATYPGLREFSFGSL